MTSEIARTLLTILENQVSRRRCAFEDLPDDAYRREPGGDCNSIRGVGEHLLALRRFQLSLLGSARAGEVSSADAAADLAGLNEALDHADALLADAIRDHDPDDWYHVPETPREGKWGDEPTLLRFVRPFSDFTNHLGGVRSLRRIYGCGAERTQ